MAELLPPPFIPKNEAEWRVLEAYYESQRQADIKFGLAIMGMLLFMAVVFWCAHRMQSRQEAKLLGRNH